MTSNRDPTSEEIRGQYWFLRCVKAMKLHSAKVGLCDGYSYAALPMIFRTDEDKTVLSTFNQRTIAIYEIYRKIYPDESKPFDEEKFSDAFQKEINKGLDKRKEIINAIQEKFNPKIVSVFKKRIPGIQNNFTIDQIYEVVKISLKKELEKKYSGISEEEMTKAIEKEITEYRIELYGKYYGDLNKAIDARLKLATPDELEILKLFDMQIFMEEVDLLFNHFNEYPELFASSNKAKQQALSFITPAILERGDKKKSPDDKTETKDPISEVDRFIGAYKLDDLTIYFKTLRETLVENSCNQPLGFILRGVEHTIAVGYDPLAKEWILVDSNDLPVSAKRINDDAGIAENVLSAFFGDIAVFETISYANKNVEEAKKYMRLWKDKSAWQEIHSIPARATWVDSDNNGLLALAARNGNLNTAKKLLAEGAKPDELSNEGSTTLELAIQHPNVVQLLLEHDANPHRMLGGYSYLYRACNISPPSFESAKLLLKKGANPNIKYKGYAVLHTVAEDQGKSDFLKLLLNDPRTDLSLRTPDEFTPFAIAQEFKNYEAAILISRAECKKVKDLKFSEHEIPSRRDALIELKNLATKVENENDMKELIKLDGAFYAFSTLDRLYKELPKELREINKSNFAKAYDKITSGSFNDADKIIKHLKHAQFTSQIDKLRKDISRLTHRPNLEQRDKALKRLQDMLKEIERNPNELSIENLKVAYEVFTKIDKLAYNRISPFVQAKRSAAANDLKNTIEKIYGNYSLVKDNNYDIVLAQLNQANKLASNKGFIVEAKEQIVVDTKSNSQHFIKR